MPPPDYPKRKIFTPIKNTNIIVKIMASTLPISFLLESLLRCTIPQYKKIYNWIYIMVTIRKEH